MTSLLKGLSEETVVLLGPSTKHKLPFRLEGIVRLVDEKGRTLGLVLDKETLDAVEEELEASSPAFLDSLEASRRSGRVSGKEVKKRLGLA